MVKAEVRYNGEHFRAVAKAQPLKTKQKITVGIFVLLSAAVSGWMLSEMLTYFRKGSDDLAILFAIMFVMAFSPFLKVVKAIAGASAVYSRIKPSEQMRYFEIDENALKLIVEGDIEHSERLFRLSGIHRAVDTGEYFVIYMYQNMYCMLAYTEITEGTPEELRSLLYNAIGDKFTITRSK
ncbi:MAG: hypothetical protein IKO47_02305 [Ruminococcus sp.]|nr:hypothetical protein [Ruminococcus sp.]